VRSWLPPKRKVSTDESNGEHRPLKRKNDGSRYEEEERE